MCREGCERTTAERGDTRVADVGAESTIEADRAAIGIPHTPLEARETTTHGLPGDGGDEGAPNPAITPRRQHEQVVHPQLSCRDVGVVADDERRVADDASGSFCHQDAKRSPRAERVAAHNGRREGARTEGLVSIQRIRHAGDHGRIGRTRAPDAERGYAVLPQSSLLSHSSPKSFSVCGNGLPVLRS